MAINIPIVSSFNDKGLKQAQSQFQKFGSSIKKGLRVAGLAAAAVVAIGMVGARFAKMAEEAAVANNRLDQIAQSMGIFGDQTTAVTDRLKAYADANKFILGADDEVIKSTQAKLLTFKNLAITADVAGGAFDRATQVAFDMAAVFGGDGSSNAVKLGKALQDPIKGVSALTRVGVTFTDQEKEFISTLVESGNTLKAQEFILSAIEAQVGGTAEATATASTKMSIAFGEMGEAIGTAVLPMFEAFANSMVDLTPTVEGFFATLTDPTTEVGQSWLSMSASIVQFGQTLGIVFGAIDSSGIFKGLLDILETVFIGLSQITWVAGDAGKTIGMLLSGDFAGAGKQITSFFDRYNGFVDKLYKDIDDTAAQMAASAEKLANLKVPSPQMEKFEGSKGQASAKKAGQKTAKTFMTGVEMELARQKAKLDKILADFAEATPVKDEWTELGSVLGNQIIGGLSKSIEKVGSFIGNKSIRAFKEIYKKAAALQDAFVARTQFQTKLKEDIMSMFDFQNIKNGLGGIIKQFKDQVEQTKKFRDNLIELQKLGLSGDLFRKIAESQDFDAAAELVKGGAGAVGEINSLYGQLQGFSNEIATVSGNALYNLGVDSATGFVRTLEEGFVSLKSLADLEKQKAQVIAAQNAAAALTPFNSGLNPDQIKAIQKKAAEDYQYYLGRFVDPITGQRREGILRGPLQNAQLRTNLDQYFLGGGQMNGDVSNQLAYLGLGRGSQIAAERAAREQARAERYGRSVTVNVNGGISTSAQIGQSVVDAIRAYERSSGQVFASA